MNRGYCPDVWAHMEELVDKTVIRYGLYNDPYMKNSAHVSTRMLHANGIPTLSTWLSFIHAFPLMRWLECPAYPHSTEKSVKSEAVFVGMSVSLLVYICAYRNGSPPPPLKCFTDIEK